MSSIKGGLTRAWKRCPNYSSTSTNGANTVKELYLKVAMATQYIANFKLLKPFEEEYCNFPEDGNEQEELLSLLANTGFNLK